jgi:diaminopimelate decarboxylase
LRQNDSPFFLFSIVPIQQALAELETRFGHLPVRHWLSLKTQPVQPLLQWWCRQSRSIEVVSEFEFLAALQVGFPPERILLNGPAKHHWLPCHARPGLRVNFDSPAEARALAPLAKKLGWITGVRILTRQEFDPEAPRFPTQFGMETEAAISVIQWLCRTGVPLETVHFHLRTNVPSARIYERALVEVADICRAADFTPKYVDCGGGFPPRHVLTRAGQPVDAHFALAEMARVYERALQRFPGAQELWLENGRWLSARSGVLVVRVLDTKERRGLRHLICDGGRTLHALVSNWEQHELLSEPARRGPRCLTTVTGPTCMAFDQLVRRRLPRALRPGDHLIWLEAAAYHLPWETRFSHGLAAAYWHDGQRVKLIRSREGFADWWCHSI